MKHTIWIWMLAALLLNTTGAQAQYNIQIQQNPNLDKLCMGLVYAHWNIRLYNGTTNVTNTTPGLKFVINRYAGLVPSTGYNGAAYFCSGGGSVGQPLYYLTQPGDIGTSAYTYGDMMIYAITTGNGCILAQKAVTIYPDNSVTVPGILTGPANVGQQGVFYLNQSTTFGNGAQMGSTAWINGYLNPFYSVSVNGGSVLVQPYDNAPLSPTVTLTTNFTPANSPCAYASSCSTAFSRVPVITHNLGSNSVICNGQSAALTVNVADVAGYPGIPSNHYEKHFTYQWYRNGSPVGGANSRTHNTTQAGTYYVAVTEYGQVYSGGNYTWSGTPTVTKNSGNITLYDASGAQPTSNFNINGTSPSSVPPGPGIFHCNPIVLNNTSSGTIRYYKLEIRDAGNNNLVGSATANTAPPSSIDLKPLMNGGNPVTGVFKIRLFVSTGCPGYNESLKEAYVNISPGPQIGMHALTNSLETAVGLRVYDPVSTTETNADHVGKYTTIFYWTGTFGLGAKVCSYDLYLDEWTGSAWNPVWNDNYTVTNCSTVTSLPQISIAALGPVQGTTPYFHTVADGSIWRLRASLANDCGTSAPIVTTFQMDFTNFLRQARPGDDPAGQVRAQGANIRFSPVPFTNHLDLSYDLEEEQHATLEILAADGRLMTRLDLGALDGRGESRIDAAGWPAGFYMYQLTTGNKVYKGKLVKQ